MIETKSCIICSGLFARPPKMNDDHWARRMSCNSESCARKMKSLAGKKGGAACRERKRLPFVAEEVKQVVTRDRTWDPLDKFALREPRIAWLFQ